MIAGVKVAVLDLLDPAPIPAAGSEGCRGADGSMDICGSCDMPRRTVGSGSLLPRIGTGMGSVMVGLVSSESGEGVACWVSSSMSLLSSKL